MIWENIVLKKETVDRAKITTNDEGANKNEEQEPANVIIWPPCAAASTVPIINTITSPSISVFDMPSIAIKLSNISRLSSPTRKFKSPNSAQD